MVGLIVLALAVGWLIFAAAITCRIAQVIAPKKFGVIAAALGYPVIFAMPFADEAIGRWQFSRLCASEAKVWVASTANQVKAAQDNTDFVDRDGLVIPVQEQSIAYLDTDTGKPFYTIKAFHTPGGWIMRAGLNMGGSNSCWPQGHSLRANGIDIEKLLKQGEPARGKHG